MKHKGLFLLFTILLTLFAVSPAAAQQLQKFHVESFGENPFDMSACEKPTARDDGTGVLYAIIKVTSTDPDDDLKAYKFNFNYLKDVREMHDGVLWVFVQNGAKTVDITRDGFHTIRRYNLETTLQPGKVYDMVLKPEPKVVSMQFLMFEITPADCKGTVMITEEGGTEKFFGLLDGEGTVANMLVLGKYYYRILSDNYHPTDGIVTLTEPDGKHIEKVTLRPNFAGVTLSVDNGAEIYINKEKKGVGSWKGNLAPGTYSIECRKANHQSTTETITVTDGVDITHTLKAPTPIVGGLVVNSTPLRAKVLIDGEAAGETPLIKKSLLIGNHKVTISKEGYESATFDILISENENIEKSIELKKMESPVVSQGNAQNSGNGNSANLGSKTSAPYKVGDYYNDGTKEGIVFEVSNGGHKGMIVSLNHIKSEWYVETDATSETDGMYNMQKIRSLQNWQNDYPAFAWCASLGDGWYLPALEELKVVYKKRARINKTLKAKGKPKLESSWHWSSTQNEGSFAWGVNMPNGDTDYYNKHNDHYVRAVSAFNAKSSAISAQKNGSTANSGSRTSAPYKVGDYYNDGTKEGVVFAVSNGGYSGKIVSLEQKDCKWSEKEVDTGATSKTLGMYNMQKIRSLPNWQNDYPAFAWCVSLGDGWYLPAHDELYAIYAQRTAINKALKAKGKSELAVDDYHWSSTQFNEFSASVVGMHNGYTRSGSKPSSNYVRAVSAFSAEGSASSSKTSAPYKIGDYYNDGTKEGIVFAVSNGGYNGKIVSLEEKGLIWSERWYVTGATSEIDGMYNMQEIRSLQNWQNDYPAFAWCASLGDGWYLPALDELKVVYNKREYINRTLKAKEKKEFGVWYWSSTQDDRVSAWGVVMPSGGTYSYSKSNRNSVRAVSAFGTEDNASSAQSLSKTSAPYKIGDYYNDGTKEGIVFEISNSGYNGKIVSLEEKGLIWSEMNTETGATSTIDGMYNMQEIRSLQNWQNDYPAFAWCASLGDGWYLPALDELKVVYNKREYINRTLKAKGKPELESYWHWSSTQDDKFCAWRVDMANGSTFDYNKSSNYYVRAVSAF